MLKWLLVLPLIAFFDPFLLYWMWPHLSLGVKIGALIGYPLFASFVSQSRPIQEGDMFTRPLRIGVRIAAWYPGPISKFLSIFLLVPSIERALARVAIQRLQQHILRGVNIPQQPPSSPVKSAPLPGDEKLKRARGRVIE